MLYSKRSGTKPKHGPQHSLMLIGGPPWHLTPPKLFLSYPLLLLEQSLKKSKENFWLLPREKEFTSGSYWHRIVYQNIKFGRNPTVTSSPSPCWWSWRHFQIFPTGLDTLCRKWSTSSHFKDFSFTGLYLALQRSGKLPKSQTQSKSVLKEKTSCAVIIFSMGW